MLFVYDLLVHFASLFLKMISWFSPKMKLFVDGRKTVFETLNSNIAKTDKTIWFHAASLGEYEQGLPVMLAMKQKFPDHKIVLTFFSPSGFEVRKSNAIADVTVYLPLDTIENASKFVEIVHPEMAFFIKYEFWPNYLNELKKRKIRTFLISGIFRKEQLFFKWYGGFYRKALDSFEYFFVQNATSKDLLSSLGKANVTVSGDTRFDRVSEILNKDNSLDFMFDFCADAKIVVIGSSWPADESLLTDYINSSGDAKFIFAPHNIKEADILALKNSLQVPTVLFSEKEGKNLSDFKVMIVNNVGLLTKIYSYADVAYVGGGFGNPGVHNILEPATFGIPVIIGPNYSHFAEAVALVSLGGCISISTQKQLDATLNTLLDDKQERNEKGHICETFVQMNQGATGSILNYFSK